jgi:transposase
MHCSALGQAPLRRTGVPGVAEAASASPSAAGRILTRLSSPMRGVSRSSGSPRSVAAFRSERFGTSRIATGEKYRDPRSRLSRLVIVSTAMERDEGHPSYPSQSLYPAKGTTVGGEWDDPDDSILTMRLHVMQRTQELKSATLACQEAGISRTVFYRWRKRFERYGPDGLHPRRHQPRPGRPRQIALHVERLIMGVALAWPTSVCGRVAAHVARDHGLRVAPSTVQRILRRERERESRAVRHYASRLNPATGPGIGHGTGSGTRSAPRRSGQVGSHSAPVSCGGNRNGIERRLRSPEGRPPRRRR